MWAHCTIKFGYMHICINESKSIANSFATLPNYLGYSLLSNSKLKSLEKFVTPQLPDDEASKNPFSGGLGSPYLIVFLNTQEATKLPKQKNS